MRFAILFLLALIAIFAVQASPVEEAKIAQDQGNYY
jgi:hypothetical protein